MPHILGQRIRLREYRKEDIEEVRKWVNDGTITSGLHDLFQAPQSMNMTESFIEMRMKPSQKEYGFVIAELDSEAYIGQVDLQIDWKNRTGTFGIVIGNKAYHGAGYGEEALRLLMVFAFDQLGLHRLQLDVISNNERAYRSYKRCGFTEEGRLRERIYRDGMYLDFIAMGILRKEFYQDERNQVFRQLAAWTSPQVT
ncbi:GNAT family N-acetyltransferase [Paenibacillus arenosi]|uniref:GNAT family N-acetyltransferase n=1 Tax=Paenibacillus arenosi TaxID=2774142 RepID=A0ABR9AUN9_9BACL|nr:GNAT family protein [Paenibacillus arenosi]MBD8497830.1 GNAT family N-acetyltransferase [Paenibacillus arenosi]